MEEVGPVVISIIVVIGFTAARMMRHRAGVFVHIVWSSTTGVWGSIAKIIVIVRSSSSRVSTTTVYWTIVVGPTSSASLRFRTKIRFSTTRMGSRYK